MTTELKAALEARAPEFAADYARRTRSIFEQMVRDHGPTLKRIHNSNRWARTYSGWIARVVTASKYDPMVGFDSYEYSIDEAKLAKVADEYGRNLVLAWYAKIMAKTEGLANVEIAYVSGTGYVIKGEKAGRKVSIEQSMIMNVSSRGTLFNQFPARIYVDGKFTSEAKFKKEIA
jgi:hypothetical protein